MNNDDNNKHFKNRTSSESLRFFDIKWDEVTWLKWKDQNPGFALEGKLVFYDNSKMYDGKTAIIRTHDGDMGFTAPTMLKLLFEKHNIEVGQAVRVTFSGKGEVTRKGFSAPYHFVLSS